MRGMMQENNPIIPLSFSLRTLPPTHNPDFWQTKINTQQEQFYFQLTTKKKTQKKIYFYD